MNILGISAFYHDSAACLIRDGEIIAAAQEERFTRKRHDAAFPVNAVRHCLEQGGASCQPIDAVVFYDKPLTKFTRLLKTSFAVAPRGLKPFLMAMPVWMRQKLWIPSEIEDALSSLDLEVPEKLYFTEHHESHAASAFFPSPFESAAVITMDGVGEWATTSIAHGQGNRLEILEELHFPHSLGLLYSALTYFAGFRVNSGEYKLMGLAPYGKPTYVDLIREHLIDSRPDGSFALNMKYFGYCDGLTMTNERFDRLLGGPPRQPEAELTRREMDLARSIQVVIEEQVLKIAAHARELTGEANLCLAGGVALNCVANGKLMRSGIFDDIWIQPAAGDAGGAVGAALFAWHQIEGNPRTLCKPDAMNGSYLGPEFSDDEIAAWLEEGAIPFNRLEDGELEEHVAQLVADQNVIGLFQGRMEFGPRALGNRSIIGDARSPAMQSTLNLKIKYRESFRPFAPSCLEERITDYFDLEATSPYMLVTADVHAERRVSVSGDEGSLPIMDRLNQVRSDIPAITHVDGSARVQSVSKQTNPRYHRIIEAFQELTGYGLVINTSFNVRGEPIVCTPEDAYRCFRRTEMDTLVMGNIVLQKNQMPEWSESSSQWQEEFALD